MSYDASMQGIRLALFNAVKEATGIDKVFFRNTNFPKQSGQHILIHLANTVPLQGAGSVGHDAEGKEITYVHYKVNVDFWCLRDTITEGVAKTPMAVLMGLRHSFDKREFVAKYFSEENVGINQIGSVQDRSISFDTTFEQRAKMSAIFHIAIEDVDTISDGQILTVSFAMNESSDTDITYTP